MHINYRNLENYDHKKGAEPCLAQCVEVFC